MILRIRGEHYPCGLQLPHLTSLDPQMAERAMAPKSLDHEHISAPGIAWIHFEVSSIEELETERASAFAVRIAWSEGFA
ncbi:hypothetical protein FVEG_14844 [Fusarium verticillioides 7600]|uniref:Uncharacterized protein n=1 Tax=Gibberella moniliformis (strain M3125 / FGSC 7600) TaxID=334819 RepID=W7LRN9_GIBM7|nr:hypothetical protein FVEG_14844 [Fusarium verticillioides 7600]EWG38155.1 hypothetical protein FVEG_14844 [Fusarium verticillioides 7600]